MATLKQMKARKNFYSVLLALITIITCYFAYTREDIYLFNILGSLLYAAPVIFYILLVTIRIRWKGTFWPTFKFLLLVVPPLYVYGLFSMSTPNEYIVKEANNLRIASYNIHSSEGSGINKQLEVLEKVDADILSLLEVNPEWEEELKNYSQTYPFTYKVDDTRANSTVGLTMLLSKYPIHNSTQHEDGYIAQHQVKLAHKTLSVVQLHPLPPLGKNLANKRDSILEKSANLELGEYKIYLGDFNAVSWQQPMQKILTQQGLRVATKNTPTWPVPLPMAPIDHILTSFNLTSTNTGKVCTFQSDHCLVYNDIYVMEEPSKTETESQEITETSLK